MTTAYAQPPQQTSQTTFTHPEIDAENHLIEIEDFSLFYGRKQALHAVSMKMPIHKVTSLIGPSGCGKSTLLRSINRLNDLVDGVSISGEMAFKGQPIYGRNVDVIELRKRLGMVFQKSNPFPMTIFENVVYALRIAGQRSRRTLARILRASAFAAAGWSRAT